ncbi:hypothetical protein Taro_023360 [Colocasia esculenta]|uniref:Epidermal patterning factor-like protein n=1 Tax=Colocasia esculenta TaxID=4460 RepID=A0A843V663_COLES|nr:hypothetical protein [Colocasia esculenta]
MSSLRRHGRRLSAAAAAVALLFFATALGGELIMAGTVETESDEARGMQELLELRRQRDHYWATVPARRRLIGPGSSPPTCRARCGRCSPCRPVHIVIQPGRSSLLEYYPEAWRCQCGNKLFMP